MRARLALQLHSKGHELELKLFSARELPASPPVQAYVVFIFKENKQIFPKQVRLGRDSLEKSTNTDEMLT